MKIYIPFLFLVSFALTACMETNPNKDQTGNNVLKNNAITISPKQTPFNDTVYVPIYSDIYNRSKDIRFNLTATLSIRNTSIKDTIYVNSIEYYDTEGNLVQNYIENSIFLKPLETIDYVVEEEDTKGGSGANFLITWSGKTKNLKPIFQAVMVSINGQQGLAFTTNGVSISQ